MIDPPLAGPPAQPVDPQSIATDFDWLVYADATFAGLAILRCV